MKRLQDKVALITGGGGGIGGAIGVAYAREGAKVCLCDLNGEAMDEVIEEIVKAGSDGFKFITDVTDSKAVDAAVKEIVGKFGSVDILVNTAGTYNRIRITEMDDETWDRTIKIHLYGAFYSIRAVLRESMLSRGAGRIINIASLAPYVGGPSDYASAKGGIVGLNLAAARELARKGINVNAIAPGYINTPMTHQFYSGGPVKELLEKHKIAQGRVGTPEDITGTAVFLASDESSYITGQVIFVDGLSIG